MKNVDKLTETVIKIVAHLESRTNAYVDWDFENERYHIEANSIPILSFEKDFYIHKEEDDTIGKVAWLKPSLERGIKEFEEIFQMQIFDVLNKVID